MPAAIKAYSIAVAPASSEMNLENKRRTGLSRWR
jgi:hypothetical protein